MAENKLHGRSYHEVVKRVLQLVTSYIEIMDEIKTLSCKDGHFASCLVLPGKERKTQPLHLSITFLRPMVVILGQYLGGFLSINPPDFRFGWPISQR